MSGAADNGHEWAMGSVGRLRVRGQRLEALWNDRLEDDWQEIVGSKQGEWIALSWTIGEIQRLAEFERYMLADEPLHLDLQPNSSRPVTLVITDRRPGEPPPFVGDSEPSPVFESIDPKFYVHDAVDGHCKARWCVSSGEFFDEPRTFHPGMTVDDFKLECSRRWPGLVGL